MKSPRPLRALLLSLACSAALVAQAQAATRIDIPAGDLAAARAAYARQSGVQLVYRADQLQGARSPGLSSDAASPQALDALLAGSGFRAQRDDSGAVLIVAQAAAPAAAATTPGATTSTPAQAESEAEAAPQNLETILVTGSRIARPNLDSTVPVTSRIA